MHPHADCWNIWTIWNIWNIIVNNLTGNFKASMIFCNEDTARWREVLPGNKQLNEACSACCVDALTARAEAEGRLRAAQATLRALDDLGVKLTAFATLRDDEGETEEGDIGITLTVSSLGSGERQAVLELLQGLDFPSGDEDCLSCEGSKHAALPALRARLPTHGVGVTLKAGAILIRGNNEVCIYYDRDVKPTEAPGAKILGYITTNLELIGEAKPKGSYHLSGWGNRWHCGSWVELQNVKFV
ncbi:uncharacterized protein LOC117640445 [Thrips palmi]|uniref:Uncharacterized protein LOC117640445 n=1 Tax=Thrips palmi TaxID=161013 RepID=A0A6P8ZI20_THRPL|nr:uncharacterized protein LOC117640445 [Thrips palmi]